MPHDAPHLPELTGDETDQAEAIALLSDPATHGGAEVERVDTHISRIFLAGDRAWKLKRAVRTNFLDFSTPEKREAACRRELELNRAGAGFYLGVTPVTCGPEGLRLGGEGEAVDWLVEMRRFDRSQELDKLAEAGALDARLMEELADAAAAAHARAPETPAYGDAEDVRARIDQIAGALEAAVRGGPLDGSATPWRAAAQRARAAQDGLIRRRRRLGRVRRCHGDLHLGNVVMIEGRPTPFDAIEFDEAIASIDTLYDLALTLEDLIARGLRGLACVLLSRYLATTRDHEGLALLPLYISMRGAIRAMAAAGRGAQEEAAGNLRLARAALAAEIRPRLVAVGGISGTGKTSLARAIAPDLAPLAGAVMIRSDVTRKRLAGAPPEARLDKAAYSERMNRRVMARMARDARRVLRAGLPVVLDATFLGPDWRDCAARLAQAEGVRFDGLWLTLPLEEAVRRVEGRRGDASDATAEVVRGQAGRGEAPAGWTPLDASGPLEATARAARDALGLCGSGDAKPGEGA
ncbi:MAG: AAA family ATPase [Pseudomonadota bacterium]